MARETNRLKYHPYQDDQEIVAPSQILEALFPILGRPWALLHTKIMRLRIRSKTR
jgi:hypothetical protein